MATLTPSDKKMVADAVHQQRLKNSGDELNKVVVTIYQRNKSFLLHTYGPLTDREARQLKKQLEDEAREEHYDRYTQIYVRKLMDKPSPPDIDTPQ